MTAIEAFVHDLGAELRTHTEQQGRTVITPIELYVYVLATSMLGDAKERESERGLISCMDGVCTGSR